MGSRNRMRDVVVEILLKAWQESQFLEYISGGSEYNADDSEL